MELMDLLDFKNIRILETFSPFEDTTVKRSLSIITPAFYNLILSILQKLYKLLR